MRFSTFAVFGLLSLTACASGRVVVAESDPAPSDPTAQTESSPPPAHKMQGPVAMLGIPPGQYPPLGACRVWMPGTPPGHQPEPCSCFSLLLSVPPGAWVLYRPADDETVIQVTEYTETAPSMVASVSYYDATSGKYLRSREIKK